ncbi:MAG: NAD-dependent epimerase/dehydratase family protein [Chloroflexi bacterium]|nr:NAD-dependent epimerase/dehydratase family protein [Chloroflexota bacterium]
MRKKASLVTGANGEVGHGLIRQLHEAGDKLPVIALDINQVDDEIANLVDDVVIGDILDTALLDKLMSEYEIDTIYHLAALLSTRAEFTPEAAHRVNVQGTINLLHVAIEQARWRGQPVKFLFPSSIAVFGMPDLDAKMDAPPVGEDDYITPITMYGCNKVYCEHLGRYYNSHYRQLAQSQDPHGIDFRCVRYPGLISAVTLPSGGTSDYGPEMIHAAAKNEPYQAFVRPDTIIPFMAMPDAIKALMLLKEAPETSLTRRVYNITSFSLSAEQIAERVKAAFPQAQIGYEPSPGRQKIVDSWPARLDDSAARADWGWSSDFDADAAFNDYLFPAIRQRYQAQ